MPRDYDSIPEELRRLSQWILWKAEPRAGKVNKIPWSPSCLKPAKTNDPGDWSTFSEAVSKLNQPSVRADGIGFVFTEPDPFVGIDLDNALDPNGRVKPWARKILDKIPKGAYVDRSPSRRGLHVILKARKRGPRCKRGLDDGAIEIYDQKRYFTMTGNCLFPPARTIPNGQTALDSIYGSYLEIDGGRRPKLPDSHCPQQHAAWLRQSDEQILERAFNARNSQKIRATYENRWNYPSPSEGDLALCNHLWFWTGDRERVDAMFRKSPRMRREWAENHSKREATLEKACQGSFRAQLPGSAVASKTPSTESGLLPHVRLDPKDQPQCPDSHKANAWRIAQAFGHELLYAKGLGSAIWTGRRWSPSESEAKLVASRVSRVISQEAQQIFKEASGSTDEDVATMLTQKARRLQKWARNSEQGSNIRESLELAQAHLSINGDALDNRPWLLNVEGGTLDLRTRELRPHSPGDYLTHIVSIPFDPSARAPRWGKFIAQIMNRDPDRIRYLQKALGYSITGSVDEQCLFLALGTGGNGKSALLSTVQRVIGPALVTKAPSDLLTAARGERHPTDLAALRGSRLAVIQEASPAAPLDIQRLKELTGDQTVKARKMRKDFFDLPITFKLWFAVNEIPLIDPSPSLVRRLHVVPFEHTVRHRIRGLDRKLAEKEGSGILNWLVEGVRLYLKEGLEPLLTPTALRQRLTEADSLALFVEQCCVQGHNLRAKAKPLWIAYERFCRSNRLTPVNRREFSGNLIGMDFPRNRQNDGHWYSGLALKEP